MKKIWISVLLLLVLLSLPLKADNLKEFDITSEGKISEHITYNHQSNEWRNLLAANLHLSCAYKDHLRFYVSPKLAHQTSFDDLGKVDFQLKESYLDLYLPNLDLRFGKQLINWGSAYKLNPTNKVNPLDLTTTDPTAFNLGVLAVQGEYYLKPNIILSGVLVGQFVPAKLPEHVQKTQSENLRNSVCRQLSNYIEDPTTVSMLMRNLSITTIKPAFKDINDLEYALKLTQRDLFGYDLSLSFFSGYEDFPSLNSNLANVIQNLMSGQLASIDLTYQHTNSVGLDLIGEIQGIGLWAETAMSINKAEEKLLEGVLGGDYTFQNNLYTVLQYYHRNPLDEEKSTENYLLLHTLLPLRQIHQLSTTIMYDLKEQAFLLNPEIKLSLYENLVFSLGMFYTSNLNDSSHSLLNNYGNTQTYVGISYGF